MASWLPSGTQGGRGPRALDLGPGLELDERDGFLERVAHPAVPLLGEGSRERGQRPASPAFPS